MQSTEPETWKPVVGYEGLYEVSNLGRVKRIAVGPGARAGRILKARRLNGGHLTLGLYRDGKREKFLVHRLVLLAFVGPCPDGMQGCHAPDPDPSNNRLSNLRWDTQSENEFDKVKHGAHYLARKTHCLRGHELAPWNLSQGSLAQGMRGCLACSRARGYARYHGAEFTKELADSYYDAIRESHYKPTNQENGEET